MAKCLNCSRSGWFLSITERGLCDKCAPTIESIVEQRARIISDCLKIIETSKKLDTKLSRCDVLLSNLEELEPYELKGIPTITPLPSQLLAEYIGKNNELIFETLHTELEKAIQKAELASGLTSKLNSLSKMLIKIQDYKEQATDPNLLDGLENILFKKRHEIQLSAFLEAARKAEFKGQYKKALDQYYEALYFLKNDDIDDTLQKDSIERIETKISKIKEEIG